MFSGAQYVPQAADMSGVVWPPQPGHPSQMPNDLAKADGGYDENTHTTAPGPDAICAGVTHVVKVTNGDLLANGGSLSSALAATAANQRAERILVAGRGELGEQLGVAAVLVSGRSHHLAEVLVEFVCRSG